MKKKIMITLGLLAVFGIGLYFYMFKSHRDIASEHADFEVTVAQLRQQFSENASKANQMYADKTIAVSGKITALDSENHAAIIDEHLSAVFSDSTISGIGIQKQVKIKGRFVGYDDLLEEFKVDQVSVEQ